jgi:hypothetical protein
MKTFCGGWPKAADNPADNSIWEIPEMKTLFLGHFAATVAPRILANTENAPGDPDPR